MTIDTLSIISSAMTELSLNYGLLRYEAEQITYPYFVGEYSEAEPQSEDGLQESTFMLTGFHRGAWLELENAKEDIEEYFSADGRTYITNNGHGVAICYANALVVPSEDLELKRIQINLAIKEWKV